MTTEVLQSLIDKRDGFEIVGDLIAEILVDEFANQQKLAVKANKNPEQWAVDVYRERSNPLQSFEFEKDSPIRVNIWYDTGDFPKNRSDPVGRQMHAARFNLDIYAVGYAENIEGEGHQPGDEAAAMNLHRGIRLVRNILMSSNNIYLQRQGYVWGRWIESITAFQPEFNNNNALQVQASRIIFNVDFNEFSPQYEGETLETVFTELKRASDGRVLSQIEINYNAEG